MTLLVGAVQYLTSAKLANTQGISPSTPSLLANSNALSDALEASRNTLSVGLGVSAAARDLNKQLLNRSADVNQMFSLGLGTNATLDGMRQQILAMRSSIPVSMLDESVTQVAPAEDRVVDTEA